jgi:hypothetical protein
MKFLFSFIASILLAFTVNAQGINLNLFLGTSNYQGDLQDKRFTFNQSHLAAGVGLSYDLTERFSLRGGITFGKISGDDKQGRNKIRNLNFSSGLTEGHLGVQYYITPLGQRSLTPYVFAGLALYHFSPYTHDTSGTKYYLKPLSTEGQGFIAGKDYYNLTQMAIPFGGGVKLSLSDKINVGLEVGFRKLFTDYLDDVSDVYADENLLLANRGAKAVELAYRGDELKNGSLTYPDGSQRGSAKAKDWYYFTGLTLSYRLGGGNRRGDKSQWACPTNVR